MGLFNKLGREVEKFARDAKATADEGAEYECASCGGRFYTAHDECPECGSPEIGIIDGNAGDPAEASETGGPDDSTENE